MTSQRKSKSTRSKTTKKRNTGTRKFFLKVPMQAANATEERKMKAEARKKLPGAKFTER